MYKELSGEKVFVSDQYDKERDYWLEKLSGELQKTGFPPDFKATAGAEKKMDTVTFKFPSALFERLSEIINNSDSRLHMVLTTGLTLLLHKYTGHNDIIFGTPIDKQEVEGEFINNVLVYRNKIDPQMTVKDLLMMVKKTVIEASENQNYPVETLPFDLDIPMVDDEFPLFDTAALLRNLQDEEYIRHMNLNMVFSFLRVDKYMEGTVKYNSSLYEKKTVERIIKHFLHLMQEAFNHVDSTLADVSLLTGEEKNWLLVDFNDTSEDYPREKMIHQLFEDQVEKTPRNIAVELNSETVTYEELNRRANQLARSLREKGIEAETVAGIMLDSSIEVLVAVLAVLKAGGAYLPMGFEFPQERINYLLKDSGAGVLLTRESLVEGMLIECPMIYVEAKSCYTGAADNLEPVNNAANLAYIIYTSGTTGLPKGVMLEHRGVVNYIWWAARQFVGNEKVAFPLYTSISFDLTVTSIFTPLITGNTIIVYGGVDKKFYIEEVIDDNRVGVVKLTPSHLKLIRQKNLKDSCIKCLIVGGEELDTRLAREIYENFGGELEIYNEYGPTETVVGSMIYRFNPQTDNRHSVPIGIPIANTQIYLLNEHKQPVPVGVEGELYISGDGLARGYLHNPRLTEEKFVPNPFIEGGKMYKTGDLAVRLPDGNIEFRGRIDHQVKIRGYRVETGEIESKIIHFQEMLHARREEKENIVEKLDLKSVTRCKSCLIPVNYPGGIHFDHQGVCDICREYETYKDKAAKYFKTPRDFHKVVERARENKRGDYDCLMLYSGGKDSSYVLHRLIEMGLKVLAFTFDNGYISDTAFENIARTTTLLNVDHIVLDSAAMREIFVESLWSDYNVCNGCFKAVNTLGTKLAHEHNINLVVSGLTRGQIFDIKLHGLFKLGIFDEDTINERLKLFRQNYHSMTHRTSRLIGEEITQEMLENIYFADYFRYDDISTHEILKYLEGKDDGWVRPKDTGASSSNCIINDVGIYVHLKDKGCHFYAAQLSWDCRFGTITREEGVEELTSFKVDYPETHRVLDEIGYYDAFTGAVVVDIEDQTGEKALCAYILSDKDLAVSEMRRFLAGGLPDYMIPDYFTRIDSIPLTPSGKVNRKALPEPQLNVEGEYMAPGDEIEEKLAIVWAEVLGLNKENIGINMNFFEVGGHSLRATFLAAAINKEFNVNVPLVKIFEAPTIESLARYVKEEAQEQTFVSITPVETKDYYVLSSAQARLYILQQMEFGVTAYNVPNVVELEGELQSEKIENTFRELIARHESLRTAFEMIAGKPAQKIHQLSEIQFKIEYDELEPGTDNIEKAIEARIKPFIRPFHLSQAPLLRVGLLRVEPLRHILMLDMHHILTDGVSYQIFVNNFLSLYWGRELPPLPIQYKDYSQWQNSKTGQEACKQQEEYWLREFEEEIPILNLPTDYSRPTVQSFEGDYVSFEIGKEQTGALNKLARLEEATLFMVLLAAYNLLLSKLSSQEDIVVGVPVAGRNHADLEEVIGIFINMLAVRNFPKEGLTFTELLRGLKVRTLTAFENQDYSFEDFVEKVAVDRDVSRNPLFDVLFVLQNMSPSPGPIEIEEQKIDELTMKPYGFENKTSKFDLSLYASEIGGILYFTVEYCTKLFRKETILRFINYFKKIITAVVENPETKISGIEILSEDEKNRLLYDFNDTETAYPKDKVIHELFAEQVDKTPARIAIVFEDKSLTYLELDRHANRLAHYLCSRMNLKTGERLGILMDRSMNIMIALLGILKAGGAYIPIDSSYPEARIKYIIDDAEIEVVISEKGNIKVLNRLQWECKTFHTFLCMDSVSVREETEEANDLMDEKMWHYIGESAEDEITGGGWMTGYTGDPFTEEEMKEYSDNIFNKLRPLLQTDTRVLEIGCASGISMYRIAPHVGFYYGTDLSRVIIDKNKKKVKEEGYRNIALSCLPAHEISKIADDDFDIIIINSVIHYFHGHNYFRNVLRQAVAKLRDKGYLFLGDLMDQDLKDALIREMKDFKRANSDKNYRTKTNWSAELFVSRGFLEDLALEMPDIRDIDYSDKIYTIENELTKFRYDAIITVDKSKKEIDKTGIPHKYQHDLDTLDKFGFQKTALQKERKARPHDLAYVTYTSGTTGLPKGIMIEHRPVINFIKGITDVIDFNKNDSILSLTTISFDIFVLESILPLTKGSKVVIGNREEQLDNLALTDALYKEKISIFQVTPSRLQILLSDTVSKEKLQFLRYLVVGGEAFPGPLLEKARDLITGKIYNVYGPTETTVWSTIKDVSGENALNIGQPIANTKIYILNRDNKLLPIGAAGELSIGGDGLARGYWNNEKLTTEKFTRDPFSAGQRVYKTGDLARWRPDGNLEFLGRIDHQVKVRGFRIELGEIENRLSGIDGLTKAVVIDKISRNGEKYLCAYIVSDKKIVIADTRNILADTLPDYMIPSYFIRLEKIPLTPNGKVNRKALPDPTIQAGEDYTPPRDKLEETLVKLWSEELEIEKSVIGIDSNFFELGGHSLKATILVTKIHKELSVRLSLAEFFKTPTIRGLSGSIKLLTKEKFASIEPVEKKEYYPLSAAQKRFYILQQIDRQGIGYNMTMVMRLEVDFDKNRFEETFRRLIARHDNFKTSFEMLDENPVQRVYDRVPFEIEYFEAGNMAHVEKITKRFVRTFDLSQAPLLRVGMIKSGDGSYTWTVDMHHIISDGLSHDVLIQDFMALYSKERLPELNLQYKDYSEWQHRQEEEGAFKRQEEFWLKEFEGELPVFALPTDYPRPAIIGFEGDTLYFDLSGEESAVLNRIAVEEGATLFMVLLAVTNILFSKLSGREDIVIGTPIAGRRHADLERVIGAFINTLPLRNFPLGKRTFRDFLNDLKERTITAFENQEYPLENLVEKLSIKRDPSRNPLFDTLFGYQDYRRAGSGRMKPGGENALKTEDYGYGNETAKFDLSLNAASLDERLFFVFKYSTGIFKRETIERFVTYFREIVSAVSGNKDIKLEEIAVSHDIVDIEFTYQKEEEGDFGF